MSENKQQTAVLAGEKCLFSAQSVGTFGSENLILVRSVRPTLCKRKLATSVEHLVHMKPCWSQNVIGRKMKTFLEMQRSKNRFMYASTALKLHVEQHYLSFIIIMHFMRQSAGLEGKLLCLTCILCIFLFFGVSNSPTGTSKSTKYLRFTLH